MLWLLCALLPLAPLDLDDASFPIGLFSVDSPGAMAKVAPWGVDFVHTYGNGRGSDAESLAKDRAYLDAAEAAGLRVMFNLNGRRLLAREDGLAELARIVEAVKDHPALGFWYLYDEPDETHTPEQLAPYYGWLKEHTPGIPVAVASAWSKNWWRYQDQLDILMIDNYPVQHRPFPDSPLGNMTSFTHSALGQGKTVMPIDQCFNWRVMAKGAATYRNSPTAELRYPLPAELRYWCFSGLAQGVRGVFWWSYYRSAQGDPNWMASNLAPALRELREFTTLVAPAHRSERLQRDRDDPGILAFWHRDAGDYLVLVNATAEVQDFDLPVGDWLSAATLTPWGQTREIAATVSDSRLRATALEPWEVCVWRAEAAQAR